jgi:type I restriction enzyme R subunit
MKTDTTEKGLETLIMRHMTGVDGLVFGGSATVAESAPRKRGSGWFAGYPASYDREFAVDVEQLFAFLLKTQPHETAKLGISDFRDRKAIARQKFLARLQGEISRHGTIHVLRKGLKYNALSFDLFYGTPSPENKKAVERHVANRFSITRQLHYSRDETKRSLDLCGFINGLPVMTFELKNSLTKQTVEDAIEQYKRDRDPRETLFEFGRCVVHFAVDDQKVAMCTALKGTKGMAKESWFLPFDQGWNDGAGDGGHRQHPAGDPVFLRLPGLPHGNQKPLQTDRRLLR